MEGRKEGVCVCLWHVHVHRPVCVMCTPGAVAVDVSTCLDQSDPSLVTAF